jgi:8-oxo-dGTP pyrophosphatase MutT (NUDIX family)
MIRKVSKVFQQSGVIPYRLKNGNLEVLLITTRNGQDWVLPKGGIIDGMSPAASAAKEAWEEAGVVGQVYTNELDTYKYCKKGKKYEVKMFLLSVETVLEDYPEVGQRQRQWLDINQAIRQVN